MAKFKKRYDTFLFLNLVLIFLMPVVILLFDRPLSSFSAEYLVALRPFFTDFTFQFDRFSFYILYFLVSIISVGFLFLVVFKNKLLGIVFLSIFVTHLSAAGLTNALKGQFKRSRPEANYVVNKLEPDTLERLKNDYSFPSAHTSFYLSLFLPAVLVFRRYFVLVLLIPGIIIFGRIVLNLHYLSDVLGSIIIVNFFSYFSIITLRFVTKKIFKKGNFDLENLNFEHVFTTKKQNFAP